MAAVLMLLALFLSFISYSSGAYCICKDGVGDQALQKAIDYACGAGADCKPIAQNGACFQPNNVKSHCDYAVNSYYQNKAQTGATCDFSGSATLSNSLPTTVASGCSFPTSQTSSGVGGVPSTTTPPSSSTSGSPTSGTTTTGVPSTTTGGIPSSTGLPGSTSTGVYNPNGMAPTGGITDVSPMGSQSFHHYPLFSLTLLTLLLIPFLLLNNAFVG